MIASKKQLAVVLSKLKTFAQPDAALEQYATDSEVAATVLWQAYMNGDIEGKTVADLGAGTGILGIGALLLGASHVCFIEKDAAAARTLRENLEQIPSDAYEIRTCDISAYNTRADTIIQNPPFGTRDKGIDITFLMKAIRYASATYSLHKTATEEHLLRRIEKQGKAATVTRFSFPLKQTMRQHKKRIQRINVSCLEIR